MISNCIKCGKKLELTNEVEYCIDCLELLNNIVLGKAGIINKLITPPTLSSDVEEAIEYIKASVDDMFYGDNGLKPHIQEKFSTIKQALSDKDKAIFKIARNEQKAIDKLNAIEEVVKEMKTLSGGISGYDKIKQIIGGNNEK